jgi:hypothetical protein
LSILFRAGRRDHEVVRPRADRPAPSPTVAATVPLAEVFTPTRPKIGDQRLTGRGAELQKILGALLEEHAHVVLYSERGRGKTSLSNSVIAALRQHEVAVARYTCDAASTYEDIIRGLLRDLPASMLAVAATSQSAQGCAAALPDGPLQPYDVVSMPGRLTCPFLVCVIDEFDRLRNAVVRTQFADTIKQISDRGVRMLFMLVGVSDSLEQMLGEHQSIQRNLVALPLSLLSDERVGGLVAHGAAEAGLEIAPPLAARIAALSRGMPYMAQLLALRVAQATALRGSTRATEADLRCAAERLVDEAEPRVLSLYAVLTHHGADAAAVDALHVVATAEQDAFGRIQVHGDAGSVRVGGGLVPAGCWQRMLDAGVVNAGLPDSPLVSVSDRSLINHALMRGVLARRPYASPAAIASMPGDAASAAMPDDAAMPAMLHVAATPAH